jgi:hypothetical protein
MIYWIQNEDFDFHYKRVWKFPHFKKLSASSFLKLSEVYVLIIPYSSRILIHYEFCIHKILTVNFPNITNALRRHANLQKACEYSDLLTGRWHDVTILCVGYKQLYIQSFVWHKFFECISKYNSEDRPFSIALRLCVVTLIIMSIQLFIATCMTS